MRVVRLTVSDTQVVVLPQRGERVAELMSTVIE
jgi:hypothetical protein